MKRLFLYFLAALCLLLVAGCKTAGCGCPMY